MKKLFLTLAVAAASFFGTAQGLTGEYVAGNGLTTYSSMDPANTNTYLPEAPCGTVTRFTRFQEGAEKSLPNNSSCQWVLLNDAGSPDHYISQGSWGGAVGTSYDLPGSNIRATVNAINSTYIELLIEPIDPTASSDVIGINYIYPFFGTYLNTLEHDCEPVSPLGCQVDGEITSCGTLSCLKLTKVNLDPACPDCYCAKVTFDDGSIASFDVSFSQGTEIMHCYDKTIVSYTLIEKPEAECNECTGRLEPQFRSATQPSGENATAVGDQSLTLYPNPTTTDFRVEGISQDDITQVKVYAISGEEVKVFGKSQTYDINDLTKGTYVVKVFGKEQELAQFRLVKQ